jgi:hypothetical protein
MLDGMQNKPNGGKRAPAIRSESTVKPIFIRVRENCARKIAREPHRCEYFSLLTSPWMPVIFKEKGSVAKITRCKPLYHRRIAKYISRERRRCTLCKASF